MMKTDLNWDETVDGLSFVVSAWRTTSAAPATTTPESGCARWSHYQIRSYGPSIPSVCMSAATEIHTRCHGRKRAPYLISRSLGIAANTSETIP